MNPIHEIKHPRYKAMYDQTNNVVYGYEDIVAILMRGLLTNNHVLLESVPGLAKTTLAQALVLNIKDAKFGRIQMLPDTQPSDIVGGLVFNMKEGRYEPALGPIIGSNIFLADEVNRTGPKTNAGMLQAMQEKKVTIGDTTYQLPKVFMVIATMNPIEQEGTFELPEAMMDRFQAKSIMGYVSEEAEIKMAQNLAVHSGNLEIEASMTTDEILADRAKIQAMVKAMSPELVKYIVRLVRATRPSEPSFKKVKGMVKGVEQTFESKILLGASPRAIINISHAAAAAAFLNGREKVETDDVKYVARDILRHRITKKDIVRDSFSTDEFVNALLNSVDIISK
jgi:MoxR-like ATPase